MAYDELAAHLQRETDSLRAQLTAAQEALKAKTEECERWQAVVKDTVEDMECVEGCDSYGHNEGCPVAYPAVAWRMLRERLATAEARAAVLAASERVAAAENAMRTNR